MADKSLKLYENRWVSALLMTVLSVAVLAGVHTLTTGSGPKEPTTPVSIAPTDSSSCIACHTDATVIETMAVMAEDGGHGGEGG
ncbi:hypothetical protein [Anoxynatronum buryatiense]|uniref:Uncharacterized protein n=1 Tax=Anoxynatronum buryatiense TaxID=489973 RepID=A0AA46AHQ1_9CLOT|nr:hypothetical protein [Anoxynatronum buryatiense]SMP41439.1 hypothetical protein SAMN06296020_101515 [Anoxynatronum buryatiense]